MTEDREHKDLICMTPDDLRSFAASLQEVSKLAPSPPAGSATGGEGLTLGFLMQEIVKLRMQVAKFVPAEDIDHRIDISVTRAFELINLPIDKDHLKETSARVKGVMEWQEVMAELWKRLRQVLMLLALAGALKLLGISVPSWVFGMFGGH